MFKQTISLCPLILALFAIVFCHGQEFSAEKVRKKFYIYFINKQNLHIFNKRFSFYFFLTLLIQIGFS